MDSYSKEFTEAAPDVRNLVQAAAQIREKVASVRRQQKELGTESPSPADFLMRASQGLPKGEIAVREASVEGVRMRLGGEAGEDTAGGGVPVGSRRGFRSRLLRDRPEIDRERPGKLGPVHHPR